MEIEFFVKGELASHLFSNCVGLLEQIKVEIYLLAFDEVAKAKLTSIS